MEIKKCYPDVSVERADVDGSCSINNEIDAQEQKHIERDMDVRRWWRGSVRMSKI